MKELLFLKFVATNANESISTARLDLIIDSNSGNGTLEIYQVNDKDLVKTNLNQSSQLKKHKIVGAISSVFNKGNKVSINLSDLNNESMITLIIKQKSGKDISFTSNESDVNSPKLNLTYTEPVSKVTKLDLNNDISVYPNPTVDTVTLSSKGLSSLASVKVFDTNGVLLQVIPTVNKLEKIEIDFRAYGKGVYLVNLQSLDNKFRLLKVIKE